MNKIVIIALIYFLVGNVLIASGQDLKKSQLNRNDANSKIYAKYEGGGFESYIALILYRDKSFFYEMTSTNYYSFSKGKWELKNNFLFLYNGVEKNNIPIKLFYQYDIDSLKNDTKTPVPIPMNLKGDLLPDAKIYINNDSVFCFPFFDTCVGSYNQIDSVKVTFGNGYQSKWVSVIKNDYKKLIIEAQVDFLFSLYFPFDVKRYKIIGSTIVECSKN